MHKGYNDKIRPSIRLSIRKYGFNQLINQSFIAQNV